MKLRKSSLMFAFAVLVMMVLTAGPATAAKKPNILIILADDLGYSDTGPYGAEIQTPTLDALAGQGIRFSNFHTAAACTPTRGMLLTGVDNHLVGMGNMLEIMADNQFGKPGYEGYMGNEVVTVATLLKDSGYHTYMAGKWHLGKAKESLPAARGFERSIALMESGADNWEKKTYLPLYDYVHFYEGFKQIDLPDDFFSTDYYTDRLMEYIGKDHSDGKPFFAYLAFQAVHYPHHAPQKYIDKYLDVYKDGWTKLRAERYERLVKMGLMPAGLKLKNNPDVEDWNSLTPEQRRYRAKQMAVYAAMVDNMDANIGRLIDYLRKIGEYDNTLILFMSDNGADNNEQDKIFPEYYKKNFDLSYERLGLKGSYSNYGPGWASASGSPLTSYKGSASEGGMRAQLIVHYPKAMQKGAITEAFSYVTDITPTLLELAGVSAPKGSYKGRTVHPITGKSMVPLLRGNSDKVYGKRDFVAYEMAGSAAVFHGDYKLVRNYPPFGDAKWRLYDIAKDPAENNDLAGKKKRLYKKMVKAFDGYVKEFRLVEVPDDYNVIKQLQRNVKRNQIEEAEKKVPITD